MLLCWHQLSPCLVLLWLCSTEALCPSNCTCRQQTERSRRKVSCIKGDMFTIPVKDMDHDMEILEISAPNNRWNTLTITPIFQSFKNLQELRIKRSNILQIGQHPFWGVPSIKILDLSYNNITSLSDHNFRGLVNLVELNLDNNQIKILQSAVFKHLTELRTLTLQNNLIQELVPRMFMKLGKLHVLKLNSNKFFEELNPEVFKDIPELRVLECRRCGLRRINTQIYHLLPYLSHLDLGNNQMQFIASDEFRDLHRLHSLKLDGNQLPVVLEKTFINQQQLKYLCLARNRLAKVTNTAFLNLTNLTDLDISYNKLDKLEVVSMQHVADSLQRLVISGNLFNLNVIKNVLQTVYKVWDLEIAHLGLKYIPEGFLPDRIRKLNISYNNLTEVGVETFPKQLKELDIRGNKIRSLDEELIFKFEDLKYVNLSDNPWSCKLCHITPVIFHVNRTKIFSNLTCASPRFLKNRLLSSLRLEELTTCKDNKIDDDDLQYEDNKLSLVIGITSLLVFLFFCIMFVVCSCMKRRARNALEQQKREMERRATNLDHATAIFSKGEISFKFPLDLTERKVSVSTIDDIKKDREPTLSNLPNGTVI